MGLLKSEERLFHAFYVPNHDVLIGSSAQSSLVCLDAVNWAPISVLTTDELCVRTHGSRVINLYCAVLGGGHKLVRVLLAIALNAGDLRLVLLFDGRDSVGLHVENLDDLVGVGDKHVTLGRFCDKVRVVEGKAIVVSHALVRGNYLGQFVEARDFRVKINTTNLFRIVK